MSHAVTTQTRVLLTTSDGRDEDFGDLEVCADELIAHQVYAARLFRREAENCGSVMRDAVIFAR